MIPIEIGPLWPRYLEAERHHVRQEWGMFLEPVIAALTKRPLDTWAPWARNLARRVVDEGQDVPMRLPLFRSVIFPALLAGMAEAVPGSARWLSGFPILLAHSPDCREQLPEDERSERGLLLRALREDPHDDRAKKRFLRLLRSSFEYVLHELPAGLVGVATVEECDELLEDLLRYETLAGELGEEEEDQELLRDARLHLPVYRRYLARPDRSVDYPAFFSAAPSD